MKRTQKQQVLDLLSGPNPNGYTRMQIALCLGYGRASICRRVAELRDEGLVYVVSRGIDPTTKERAEFLTGSKQVAMSLPASARVVKEKPEKTGKLF